VKRRSRNKRKKCKKNNNELRLKEDERPMRMNTKEKYVKKKERG
jgi:hypothetical protein